MLCFETHDSEVDPAGQQGVANSQSVIFLQIQFDLRVPHKAFGQQSPHKEIGNRRRETKPNLSQGFCPLRTQFSLNLLESSQEKLAAFEQYAALFGWFNAPSVAHEQSDAERVFQQLNATRKGGLNHAKGNRGLRNASLPSRLHEKSQRYKIHVLMIYRLGMGCIENIYF